MTLEEKHLQMWMRTAEFRQWIETTPLSILNRLRISISLSGKVDRFFIEELRKQSKEPLKRILDVDCGGGHTYLRKYGFVCGIDPSPELLKIAARVYDSTFCCNGQEMPFANNTFDYVLSYGVFGHIPKNEKDSFLCEVYRVLKPGGMAVNSIETFADSWWWKIAMSNPALFQKYFVDSPGHIGLESPTSVLERFCRNGFKCIRSGKVAVNVNEAGTWASFFDNEYSQSNILVRLATILDKLIARNILIRECVNVLLNPIARIDCAISDLDGACGLLTSHTK